MIRRTTNKIIVHCSATRWNQDIGANEIDQWHKDNGWSGIGYHGVIRRNGSFEFGRDFRFSGAHVAGHNHDSVGICLVGGIDAEGEPENNFTDPQFETLRQTLRFLKTVYPMACIEPHNKYSNKACPSFDLDAWLDENHFYQTVEGF